MVNPLNIAVVLMVSLRGMELQCECVCVFDHMGCCAGCCGRFPQQMNPSLCFSCSILSFHPSSYNNI